MKLDHEGTETLVALRRADGATFDRLVRIAGLDPARDLRGTDLAGVDFTDSDLAGFDFSDADLTNATLDRAAIDGAVFDRARTDGVKWPPGWRSRAEARLASAPPLRARQREIAEALLEALKGPAPARGIAILPPGVGKSSILAEVFRRLSRKKAFRRGLILCETIAERDQLIHILRERGVETADNRGARDKGVVAPGTTLIETFGNHSRLRDELERVSEDWTNPLMATHVALTSLPARRRSVVTKMANSEQAPAMLAFAEASLHGADDWERISRTSLGRLFDGVSYDYGIRQAVEDGLLAPAELIDRSHAIADFDGAGEPDARARAVLEEVAGDFEMEIGRASEPTASLLLVPDVANAEQLADDLRGQLRLANDTRVHAVSVVAMAPRAKRDDWLPGLRSKGTVVATPASAEYLNLNDFGLVGILTALPDKLATRLAFPPARRKEGRRLRVLDYVGTLAGTAVRDWVEIAKPSEAR